MARGIEGRVIYPEPAYYEKFEELLTDLPQRFGVKLHTYALMPNHYHLQIETPRLNLSEAIKWLNVSYVSWFNRKVGRNGPLFQGRFKAMVHDPGETGWLMHEYIHLNPIRVKKFGASRTDDLRPNPEQMPAMVRELTEFEWSSYRAYAGYIVAPKWLYTREVMRFVPARTPGAKRTQYRQRFRDMIGAGDLGTSWKETFSGKLVLGGKDFARKVRKVLAGSRQRSLREIEKPPVDWKMIVSAIEKLWKEPWKEVCERHGDPGRELAMLIARQYGGMSLRGIGEAVGGLQYAAVSDAVRRTLARLETDQLLEKRFKRLCKILKL
jgi:REP element-mobilizing transposase RayT